ncbi:MAG TPA: G1 family glutamic endopeptidase [Bryobacteraceae bacterium]|nr:G1 family glutamic endopeptidase [Bryobacteraceae bacterium]
MSTRSIGFLGVLGVAAVAVLIGNARVPQNNNTRAQRPRFHDINRMVAQHPENGTSQSTNWSGYAALGSGFTRAVGSWVVPAATCSSGSQYASFWVGIDGYGSGTVEQLGTEDDCTGATPSYHAWYEFCCKEPEITISNFPVKPGDVIAAVVSYNGSGFVLAIKNVTTGQTYKKTGNIAGAQRASAEWIAEAPSSGGVLPLTNFGTMVFGKDSTGVAGTNTATLGGVTSPIGRFPTFYQITMVNGSGNPKAVPSILSTDLTSFSDTWVASQ